MREVLLNWGSSHEKQNKTQVVNPFPEKVNLECSFKNLQHPPFY